MLTDPPDRSTRPMMLAVLGVLAITALRILALGLSRAELFVDESQYWLWGQVLDFGYYSKPPMIAWVIRAFNELGGSDEAFWVRLAGPVFHAATALVVMAVARQLYDARVAALSALAYVTLPLTSLGSAVISTDTILFPFFALALLFWLRLTGRPSARDAVLAGLCLGLGFLSKYAAVYFLISAGLAAALRRDTRPAPRDALLAVLVFAAVITPNILWNIAHGGRTFAHTLDNANWVRDPAARAELNFNGLAEFLGTQFVVFGPVLFAVLVWSAWRAFSARAGREEARLALFSVPVLAIVSGQALLSGAYGNWAAMAYVAATPAVVALLSARAPRWLAASFIANGVLAVAVPLVMVFADRLSLDGEKLALARLMGREAISTRIIAAATRTGAGTVVASHRDILADLFHTGRATGLAFRAVPRDGPPRNHYEMAYPYDGTATGEVLLVRISTLIPACPSHRVDSWTGGPGAFAGYPFRLYLVEPDCADLGRF